MERNEILEKVQESFRDLLNDDEIVLTEDMGPNDVEGWNSLSQVQIMAELEHLFEIRFSLLELMSLNSVGSIVNAIFSHLS